MDKEFKIYDGDAVVRYKETDEKKQLLWDRFILFCEKHNANTGESTQNDDFVINAPTFIADIIDEVAGFETGWKD